MPLAETGRMMRIIFAVSIWLLIMATPAFAAQKGPKGGTSHVKTTVKVHTKTTVKAPRPVTPGVKATKVKTTSVKPPKAPKATKAAKTTTTTKSTKTSKTTTATTTVGTPATLSPVQQKLQRNTNLAAKMQSRLPPGTDLMKAAAGFRNLGQFVAAVNASHNHGLSFVELKRRIVGQGMSLGQATQDLRR